MRARVRFLALGLAAVAHQAAASGFQLYEENASGLGNAFAGQAAAAVDATTVFWNPAGLTHLAGRQVVGGLSLVDPSARFRSSGSCLPYAGTGVGTASCPAGADGNLGHTGTGDGGDGGSLAAIPLLYGSWQMGPTVWLGLGAGVPFGLSLDWDDDWVGRFHATRSSIKSLEIDPSIAWKPAGWLSLGAGVDALRMQASLSDAVSYQAVALATGSSAIIGATPPGAEGIANMRGADWAWGWNLGAMLDLGPDTRVGVSYRSRIRVKLAGDVTFHDRPAALAVVPALADGPATASVTLPDTFSIALSHVPAPRWQALADWTWTGWSSIPSLDIYRRGGPLLTSDPLKLKDSWRAGLGLNYQCSDPLKLRVGVAHSTSAIPDATRTARLSDNDSNQLAVGAQWVPTPAWALDFGYAYVLFKDAPESMRNQDTASSLPRGSLVGTYHMHANVLAVQARYSY